jgi:DNA polymerase III subunit delta'
MAWNDIIGQERVKSILQKSIVEGRVSHAYLFWGIEGIGKEALAIEFAKTVNCLKPIINGDKIDACGICSACLKSNVFQHPNIKLIFSIPTGKASDSKNDNPLGNLSDEQIGKIQEQTELKSHDYYHKIEIPKANHILVSQIREIKRNLSLGAAQQGRRVVLVFRAEEMNKESANAFLKTLEEPHEGITIIITTSRIELLMQTIISRCQQVYCEPLYDSAISDVLISRTGIDETNARLAATFAQGSFTAALEFLNQDMSLLRESVINTFRSSLKKKIYRHELIENLEKISVFNDKRIAEYFIRILILWLRDSYTLINTNNTDSLINKDQSEMLGRFAEKFSDRNIPGVIYLLENSIHQIYKNVQLQLVFLSLFIRLRGILL